MTEMALVEAMRGVTSSQSVNALNAAQMQQTAAVADPHAVQAFEAAMSAQAPSEVGATPFASQISEAWRGAQDVYQSHLHRLKSLSESGVMGTMSVAQMSALQYEVANTNFQLEVTVSVAKKASDAVQTLVKNG